jgi:O-antigen ligase
MIWLLGGYIWLFIHRPFEIWPVLGTMHLERIYMIITILYWAFVAQKTWIGNRLNIAYSCMAAAVLASAFLSPYGAGINTTVENWLKIALFYVLVVSSVHTDAELKKLVVIFLVAMGLYMSHSLLEFFHGRGVYRMGTWRMVGVDATMNDANTFSATILYALPMLGPAWTLVRNRWHMAVAAIYLGLSVVCILLTGSRSAFVGLCILSLATGWFSKHRFIVFFSLTMLAPLCWMALREDLQNRIMTIIDPSYGPKNAEASAGARLEGFMDGVALWKKYPLLGVGPGQSRNHTGHGQPHNLYGEVLGDLGSLGAISLAMVVLFLWSNAYYVYTQYRPFLDDNNFQYRVVVAAFVCSLLLLLLGWGGHNLYRYTWLWMGAFQSIAMASLKDYVTATTFTNASLNQCR